MTAPRFDWSNPWMPLKLPDGRVVNVPILAHSALAYPIWHYGIVNDAGQYVVQPWVDHYAHGDAARAAAANAALGIYSDWIGTPAGVTGFESGNVIIGGGGN